jgi:thiol-disulfide isomerase/thioredoxin
VKGYPDYRLSLVLAAALCGLASTVRAQDVGLPIGSTPVAATVQDLDGNAIDLAQYVGRKPVLVEFWATWCPVCKELEPQLAAVKEKYGDKIEILIVGVAVNQTPRSIKRHIENHALPGRVFFDAKGAAVRAFDAPTTSYIAILDRNGKVRYTGTGTEQRLLEAIAKVVESAP